MRRKQTQAKKKQIITLFKYEKRHKDIYKFKKYDKKEIFFKIHTLLAFKVVI